MTIIIGLGLALLLGGLAVMWLSKAAHYLLLVAVVWWVGLVLVVIGLFLLVMPVLIWIYGQIQAVITASK